MSPLTAIVLAAGMGKRMHSATPKVLHQVCGRPLVYYPVHTALGAGASRAVAVVGHGRELIQPYLAEAFPSQLTFAVQEPQLGTGHAVLQAMPLLASDCERVLIVYGDTPLLVLRDLKALCEVLDDRPDIQIAMLTCKVDDPCGYGRILRAPTGEVTGVREHKDLRDDEGRIQEVNAGVYAVRVPFLREALANLRPNNAQGELYLTDTVAMAAETRSVVGMLGDPSNLVGVNDRSQLADAEELMYQRIARKHAAAGATVRRSARIQDTVAIGLDAVIEADVELRGHTIVEPGATIDVGCVVTDSLIGERALVKPYSVVTSSRVGPRAQIGPFAHLRPESDIGEDAHVGNFVETKKTRMAAKSKANHLAYLGDGEIGEGANIGAGTIFCNYDGFQKHRTVIGKGAFIGSDSQIVAPITVGDGAYVGTGTTVTMDVPADALALGRARQVNKEGYGSRLRSRLAAAKEAAKRSRGE